MSQSADETPVLDLLASMTADSLAASNLDPATLMLVRIAALVAVDAPPISYVMNLEAADVAGVDPEQVRGVLAAVAPIVGTARVASATATIVEALAIELEVAMLEEAAAELDEEGAE
jgi:alkylhydroperoxidase/carboxymuconolactone decarboxylase family protein YurZ